MKEAFSNNLFFPLNVRPLYFAAFERTQSPFSILYLMLLAGNTLLYYLNELTNNSTIPNKSFKYFN